MRQTGAHPGPAGQVGPRGPGAVALVLDAAVGANATASLGGGLGASLALTCSSGQLFTQLSTDGSTNTLTAGGRYSSDGGSNGDLDLQGASSIGLPGSGSVATANLVLVNTATAASATVSFVVSRSAGTCRLRGLLVQP